MIESSDINNSLANKSTSTPVTNEDKLTKCSYCSKDFSGKKWHKVNIQRHMDMHKKLSSGNMSVASFFKSNTGIESPNYFFEFINNLNPSN